MHQSKLLLLHHSWTRIKEVRFDKALKKNPSQGFNTPFRFNILAQHINIPTHITLHELIRLLKETRKALRHLESFLIQVPSPTDESGTPCPHCHLALQQVPSITFTPEDIFLKDNKHDRPLYYIWYICSSCIERIQVDHGSALSIIPRRLLYFLGISLHKLSTMTTTIYDLNIRSSHPLVKICL